MDEDCTMII
jgi:hypothetical protein